MASAEERQEPSKKSGRGGKRLRIRGAEFQGSRAGGVFAGTGSLDLQQWRGFSFNFESGQQPMPDMFFN